MNFSDAGAWDTHYEQAEGSYEWLCTWDQIRDRILGLCGNRESTKVLDLGCGTSGLAAGLCESGIPNVTGIDVSPRVIDRMAAVHRSRYPMLRFATMDATDLSFAAGTFDLVIDKSTSDALACGGDDRVTVLASEAYRVLSPGGVLAVVSFGTPRVRLPALQRGATWDQVETYRIPKPGLEDILPDSNEAKFHFIYTLRKEGLLVPAVSSPRHDQTTSGHQHHQHHLQTHTPTVTTGDDRTIDEEER